MVISAIIIKCADCGATEPRRAPAHKYCTSCACARNKASQTRSHNKRPRLAIGRDMPCISCGRIIKRITSSHRYCQECRRRKNIERNKNYHLKISGGRVVHIGTMQPCADCGVVHPKIGSKPCKDGLPRCPACTKRHKLRRNVGLSKERLKLRTRNLLLRAAQAVARTVSSTITSTP